MSQYLHTVHRINCAKAHDLILQRLLIICLFSDKHYFHSELLFPFAFRTITNLKAKKYSVKAQFTIPVRLMKIILNCDLELKVIFHVFKSPFAKQEGFAPLYIAFACLEFLSNPNLYCVVTNSQLLIC